LDLQVITINRTEQWDRIVKSFKKHDVYYLSGYVKAFQLHGDGEPLLFYFDNGNTRAINVVIKKDISKDIHFIGKLDENKYFDLITPYGYGGFLIEGTDHNLLREQYIKWCKDNNIINEFVRFHPLINNATNSADIYEMVLLGSTVCMDITNIDKIWYTLSSKNRHMIRKAQKSNLHVYWGRDEWLLEEFIDIYNSTMDKNNANEYYYFKRSFYKSILHDLKNNAVYFYVKLNDEIISMAIIIFCNNKMHYHLSASKKQFQHLAPTNLLLYEAACWGSENGYKEFHLGGGRGTKQDSLYLFKKAFNKQSDKEFFIGKAIFNEEVYNNLLNVRKKELNFDVETSYFPKYRG
jgi:hypothetical protein